MVIVLALPLGCANAVDMPVRQSFAIEMVGPRDVGNAVALNSAMFNGARVLGPAVAGLTIGAFGMATAFAINALSFLAVLVGPVADARRRAPSPQAPAATPLGRCGLREPRRGPPLRAPHAGRAAGRRDGRADRHGRHELQRPHPAARAGCPGQRRGRLRLPHDRIGDRRARRGGGARPRRQAAADPHRRSARSCWASRRCCLRCPPRTRCRCS